MQIDLHGAQAIQIGTLQIKRQSPSGDGYAMRDITIKTARGDIVIRVQGNGDELDVGISDPEEDWL